VYVTCLVGLDEVFFNRSNINVQWEGFWTV